MSMDLNFWKYKKNVPHKDSEVYERACCDGEALDCLEPLPIDEILNQIAAIFSDWTAYGKKDYEKDGQGAFQIFTTDQIVRFDCYNMKEADMNSMMDVLAAFGCPVYDPQISTRFDSWTDC